MNTHSMRRSSRTLATALMASLLIGVMPAHAGQPSTSRCGPTTTRTLKLTMDAARPSYAPGEVAKVRVRVTREVAGYETDVATAGTRVVVSAHAGDVIMYGGGVTDERGRAIVKVKVKRIAPTGPADGFSYAWRRLVGPCFGEDGHVEVAGLFRITR